MCWVCLIIAHAESLPIRVYTIADGLADDQLHCIVPDSQGFLWLCTADGVSRFDGRNFSNFGLDQGLPNRAVADFLQTRDGEFWVATAAGLSHLRPHSLRAAGGGSPTSPTGLFEVYRLPESPVRQLPVGLAEAPGDGIWFVTNESLFRFSRKTFAFERVELGVRGWSTFFADKDGSLWLGSKDTLLQRLPDGQLRKFTAAEGLPKDMQWISAIYRDRQDHLWAGTWSGLCLMSPRLRRPELQMGCTSSGFSIEKVGGCRRMQFSP